MAFVGDSFRSLLSWISSNRSVIALVVGGTGALCYVITRRHGNGRLERGEDAVLVGEVSRVILYPVKSMRQLEEQESLICDLMGMKTNDGRNIRDRSWMVALEGGSMITQRAEPKLALIQPSFTPSGDFLMLDAPGMRTLKVSTGLTTLSSPILDVNVWGLHSDAINCGKEASDWLCEFLGKKGHILVYHSPSMVGRTINNGPLPIQKMFRSNNKVAFVEMAPVLLMTESTVEDVRKRVDNMTITETNFRPSVYIKGPERPYEEDKWDNVYIGDDVVIENTILAQRCMETTVDPNTGIMNKEKKPLETLKSYRTMIKNDPCLGLFMSVLQEGRVKVGDTVYATYKK